MSIELEQARAASKGAFDPQLLADIFYKHGVPRARLDEIVRVLEQEPQLRDRHMYRELSRAAQFRYSFRVATTLLALSRKHAWTQHELNETMANVFGDKFPTSMHNAAFKYVVRVIGSDAQGAHWLPKCDAHEVVGCYAQTELGHGSNVRALQTRAYYDPSTRQIVLASADPLTARKWWIGGLGVAADHAAVQASLYFPPKNDPLSTDRSKYEYLGPHMFIVPIRDPVSREPLPGVTVGDIGPKAANGFSIIDNGFLAMDNVRVPVDHMLNRFTSIDTSDPKGAKYVLTGNSKVMYASMTNLRAGYPFSLGVPLAKAVTIASRYLTVRRQFSAAGEQQEVQVVRYSSVYSRLVPYVALAVSVGFVNDAVQTAYKEMMDGLLVRGSDALLPEVHAVTTSIKGVVSMHCTRAIEQCQILMGGHGFSYHSGLSTLYGNALPSQTFEGENYVVAQQTAAALAKQHALVVEHGAAARDKVFPAARFLIDCAGPAPASPQTAAEWLANDGYIIRLFELRTAALLDEYVTVTKTRAATEWPRAGAALSFAFGEQYVVTHYLRGAAALHDAATRALTLRLARVLAFRLLLHENAAALVLVEHGRLAAAALAPLRAALDAETAVVAPHVVALTDAFGFSDYELNSALGCHDGRPYEHLVERAAQSTLNSTNFAAEIAELKKAGLTPLPKL